MADMHAVENWKHFESNISYLKVISFNPFVPGLRIIYLP